MIRNVITMIIGIGLTNVAHADTTVSYWGATQEENSQLSGLDTAQREGQLAGLKYLGHVLEEHPTNGPARLYRASAFMQMGRLDEALKDLDELARKRPDCCGLSEARIYYYRVKGDRANELEEMKKLVANKLANNPDKAARSTSVRWNRAWIAELSDNMVLAKKEWQESVNEAPPQQRASYMSHEVEFFLRQNSYEEAVAVAKGAVELDRRQSSEDWSLANSLTWYGLSLWVSGKQVEALAAFLDAADRPIAPYLRSLNSFDPGHKSLAILGTHVLAANGTEKDKATATKLMSALGKSATGKNPYSLEPVALALSGKSEIEPVVDAVAKVLKQAPNLDWALWAALYLGLSGQDEAKPLLMLLPKDSIQERIAQQENNVSTKRQDDLGR